MSDKLKNLIIRAITGVFFVVAMVLGILHPHGLIALFALITGLSVWEYTGLVNNIKGKPVHLNHRRCLFLSVGCRFMCDTH